MPTTSIHEACRRGDVETVRAIIAADPAVVDADDEHGWRPIFHAGLWRHEQVVRLLIEAGADLAAHDGYVMHYAGEVPGTRRSVPRSSNTAPLIPTCGRRQIWRGKSWRRFFSHTRHGCVHCSAGIPAWRQSPTAAAISRSITRHATATRRSCAC